MSVKLENFTTVFYVTTVFIGFNNSGVWDHTGSIAGKQTYQEGKMS